MALTPEEEQQATDILITAIREQQQNPHPQLEQDSGGGTYFFDGVGMYQVSYKPEWMQNVIDWFEKQAADDDGDGVSNFFDKMKGYDDNNWKVTASNGQTIGEIRPGVYAMFDSSGNRSSSELQLKSVTYDGGGREYSIGISNTGGSLTFKNDDGVHYNFEVFGG